MNLKILFIAPYPIEGPSSRFRIYQYLPHLKNLGIHCQVRPFMSSRFYEVAYHPGKLGLKLIFLIMSTLNRILDLFRTMKYDIVVIHREAFPFGPPIFEWIVAKLIKKPCIYDFDDAIYLKETSPYNKIIDFLKTPSKTAEIIKMCKHTIAGNSYLENYAKNFTNKVTVIPTPIDTEKYSPQAKANKPDTIVVGWIGSHTTARYLLPLRSAFSKLKTNNPQLEIKLVGLGALGSHFPEANCIDWKLDDEISVLRSFDMGIMPLPDDEWTRGKCGFKLIQYMAIAIPVICSPVGANKEIVIDGYNGIFAESEEEWIRAIQKLIDDKELRERMGRNGRDTVDEKYSLKVMAPLFEDVIFQTFEENK